LMRISFISLFYFIELIHWRECGAGGYSMTWPKESVIRFYNVTL
jgi:hypothetical protein